MEENIPQPKEINVVRKPTYEQIEKQLEKLEIKYEKERKYLLQKIELMDMKLKEAQEREQNIERLHNTMLKAFKGKNGKLFTFCKFQFTEHFYRINRKTSRFC
jgi:hypothetical protein